MCKLFILALASALALLTAQVTGGSITGRVTDSAGATLPNAKVELENVATGQRITVSTDATGLYLFSDVPAGRYRLVASLASGPAAPSQEIAVELGRTQTFNISLPSGPVTDALVDAKEVPTSTSTASIQRSFNTQSVHFMPQPNFISKDGEAYGAYNLSLLSEGIVSGTGAIGRGPAVGGTRPLTNNFHIEGIDNNNKVFPGPLVYLSNEATTDFALFQNQPAPVFGHASGGNFNSVVRTGTNQAHGQFYNYLQNRKLNAIDSSFARFGITENPRYDQNRMGGNLGFAAVPSKLFFFGSFEYIPLGFERPFGALSFAPTASGVATLSRLPGISNTNLGILTGNTSDIATATRNVTVAGSSIPLGLVASTIDGWMNQYAGAGSMDWTMSHRSSLRARYVHQEWEANNSGMPTLPSFASGRKGKSQLASIAHYFTFANGLNNELRLGFNRFTNAFSSAAVAYPGLNAFPNISIGDVNLAFGTQFAGPQYSAFNTFHLADGFGFRVNAMGGHNFRIGLDARRYLGHSTGFAASRGIYNYSTLDRFLRDLPPDVVSQQTFGADTFSGDQWLWFGYIQDHWTLGPNFSLDLGLRYTYATIPEGLRRQRFNAMADVPGLISFADPRLENRNFAPQFGFAWSPGSQRTVIRGGFSMVHDSLMSSALSGIYAPQYGVTVDASRLSNTPGFLARGGIVDPTANVRGDLTAAQARALTTTFVPAEQDLPYSMQWNVAVQQEIWRNMTFEAKYLGSRGMHLPWVTQMNPANRVTPERNLPVFLNRPSQSEINNLTLTLDQLNSPITGPFAAAGFVNPITTVLPEGRSWYHGLALSMNQRFSGGFQMLGTYTWSHLIDDVTGTALDLGTFGRERANSIFDRRHRVNATALFTLGSLFNDPGVLRNVFADFTVGGTYTYESPQFVTAVSGLDTALNGNAFGSRAIFNPAGVAGSGSDVSPLFNTRNQIVGYVANDPNAQFIRGAAGTLATSGRNSLRLNETNNFDVSAVKRFSYSDRLSFEIRGDAYNVFNHPQYTRGQVNNIGFGSLTAFPGFLVPGNPDFGNFQDAFSSNSRTLQVALRLAF